MTKAMTIKFDPHRCGPLLTDDERLTAEVLADALSDLNARERGTSLLLFWIVSQKTMGEDRATEFIRTVYGRLGEPPLYLDVPCMTQAHKLSVINKVRGAVEPALRKALGWPEGAPS